MSQPALSLLLMTYNQAPFLAEAIASALAQEGPPLDILISDNGSTDATPGIVAAALADYRGPHRLRAHRFPANLGGPAEHVNAALPLARERYVILQAGDDLSLPGRALACAAAFAADPALRCLYSDVEVIDAAGRRLRAAPQAEPPAGADPRLWFARVQGFALGATLALDRALAEDFPPLPSGVYEDQVLPFRAALSGRVRRLPRVLVRYREHGANESQTGRAGQSLAQARRVAGRALAMQRRLGALRLADIAHWSRRDPGLPVAALEAAVRASLAEAEATAALGDARLARRLGGLLATLRRDRRPRALGLALFQAVAPAGYLAWRRRRS